MKIHSLIILLLFCASPSSGQNLSEVRDPGPTDSVFRIYGETGNPDALFHALRQELDTSSKETAAYSWAAYQTGVMLVRHLNRDSGVAYLREVVRLNRSCRAVIKSIVALDSLSLPSPVQSPNGGPFWTHVARKNIVYHIEFPSRVVTDTYMARHDRVLDSLLSYFEVELPKPVSFFLWIGASSARKWLGKPLAFTRLDELACYVAAGNSVGHELTHAVTSVLYRKTARRSKFVYEGVAVAFDFGRYQKMQIVRSLGKQGYSSVLDVWKNEFLVPDSLLYPFAGAFFHHLISQLPPETIREAVRAQCLEDVRNVIGKERFDAFVQEFDREAGFCAGLQGP